MVIVVEGKNDANKIKSIFPDAYVLITNGSAINDSMINDIKIMSEKNEIVLCLDPDGPGEKIRRYIMDNVPNVSHVFANRKDAISRNGKKVGIEHMSSESIKKLFYNIHISKQSYKITFNELYELGYMDSRTRRMQLCERLNIGYCNAKQLVKRLNLFGITLEEVENDCR